MKHLIALALLLGWGSAQATTTTIDFEAANLYDTTLVSQGYQLSAFSSGNAGVVDSVWLGSYAMEVFSAENFFSPVVDDFVMSGYLSMEREDQQAFSLWSVDFWGYSGSLVIGTLGDGNHIYTYDPSEVGQGDWLNVVEVVFTSPGNGTEYFENGGLINIDNIVVGAAVPVPAAVWLFASALTALGWFRRKSPR